MTSKDKDALTFDGQISKRQVKKNDWKKSSQSRLKGEEKERRKRELNDRKRR